MKVSEISIMEMIIKKVTKTFLIYVFHIIQQKEKINIIKYY